MIRSAILSACLLLVTGCSLFGDKNSPLKNNRAQWVSQNLTDYSFEISIGCFCIIATNTPALITVENDSIVSAIRISDSQPVPPDQVQYIPTILELFDIIEDARGGEADETTVSYNSVLGYPRSVSIDYLKGAVDDEISYAVDRVTASP